MFGYFVVITIIVFIVAVKMSYLVTVLNGVRDIDKGGASCSRFLVEHAERGCMNVMKGMKYEGEGSFRTRKTLFLHVGKLLQSLTAEGA